MILYSNVMCYSTITLVCSCCIKKTEGQDREALCYNENAAGKYCSNTIAVRLFCFFGIGRFKSFRSS